MPSTSIAPLVASLTDIQTRIQQEVELPHIVAVGVQSAGKSSVIEAMSTVSPCLKLFIQLLTAEQLKLPRGVGTCTKHVPKAPLSAPCLTFSTDVQWNFALNIPRFPRCCRLTLPCVSARATTSRSAPIYPTWTTFGLRLVRRRSVFLTPVCLAEELLRLQETALAHSQRIVYVSLQRAPICPTCTSTIFLVRIHVLPSSLHYNLLSRRDS